MTKRTPIFLTVFALAVFILSTFPQETTEQADLEKKEALKKYIELLDSGDYVVVLANEKKVRVKSKPNVREDSELVWMFVRKKSGQYNYESINKALIDFEKTEEYNRKLEENRKIRHEELAKIRMEKQKELDAEKLKKAQLPDQSSQSTHIYTQQDLQKKTILTKALNINDIVNLEEYPGWHVVIITESENYNDIIFSVNKEKGESIFTTTIKDLMAIKEEIKVQMDAYQEKVQEMYDLGTAEGDKYKYSGKIVEIQSLLKDYEKKQASIQQIIAKLPPKPEE